MTSRLSEGDQRFHTLQILGTENFRTELVLAQAGFRKRFPFAVFACKKSVCEWEIRQEANAGQRAFQQDFGLWFAVEETVVILHGREILRAGGCACSTHLIR